MRKTLLTSTVTLIVLVAFNAFAQQGDAKGCKDHSLFPTRMPDYRIEACKVEDFGTYEFTIAKATNSNSLSR